MAATNAAPARPRPLSPHLSIYRLTLTFVMSGVHRITGMALYVGVLLLAWYLVATSMDATAFAAASGFLNSILGRLILFGFTWSLFHHMLGGLRHAIWDAGYGMEAPGREWLAIGTLVGALALTIVVWAIGLAIHHGATF
jgi:succinate dehydrogenase / fumarate reductase cytochrome b subunit